MRHLPSFFFFDFVICNPFLYSPFLKNSDPCSVLASLVFFCHISDHFKVSFYLKATLYDCKNDSKYRDVASLRPKKQVRIANAELEPVLKSKVNDYLLPCVQSKWSKKFFSVSC